MKYGHRSWRLRDPGHHLRRAMASKSRGARPIAPGELGRLGGEMARRMVEAGLAYLTECAVRDTRAVFAEAAFGPEPPENGVTTPGPKA